MCKAKPVPTFKNVRHLADLGEGGSVGPGVDHVHQVGLELVQVRLLVHVQLGVSGHFGDPLRTLLHMGGKGGGALTDDPEDTLGWAPGSKRLTCICLRGAASCSVSFGISLACGGGGGKRQL